MKDERKIGSRVRVVDQDGRPAFLLDGDDARRYLCEGYAIGLGSKTRIHCLKLTVPLALLSGGEVAGRAVTPGRLRVKYTIREHVGERYYLHQHKRGTTEVRVGGRVVSLRPAFLAVVRSVLRGE